MGGPARQGPCPWLSVGVGTRQEDGLGKPQARAPPPPPLWRRVVCWSQGASTRQHNKILMSGTIGAFRLCDTMPLSLRKLSAIRHRKAYG